MGEVTVFPHRQLIPCVKYINFTVFNNVDFSLNDSATLPREYLDQMNAYQAVFDQHPGGHLVSLRDPGNSHHHAHDYFRAALKNQLIDETEVVTESIAQFKYLQLANASVNLLQFQRERWCRSRRIGQFLH